jgi:hypothetical protein
VSQRCFSPATFSPYWPSAALGTVLAAFFNLGCLDTHGAYHIQYYLVYTQHFERGSHYQGLLWCTHTSVAHKPPVWVVAWICCGRPQVHCSSSATMCLLLSASWDMSRIIGLTV